MMKMTLDINNGIKVFDLDWWEYDIFITDKDENGGEIVCQFQY